MSIFFAVARRAVSSAGHNKLSIRAVLLLGLLLTSARAQTSLIVSDYSAGKVGLFNGTTGATINANFITGLSAPSGMAVVGGVLYVAEANGGRIGAYNASTGAVINANFITGLNNTREIAVFGSSLFVTQPVSGKIAQYDLNTGNLINASFISTSYTEALLVSGGIMYVGQTTAMPGTAGLYSPTTGGSPFATITNLAQPESFAVSGGTLFVANAGGLIGAYDASTGATINASFITTNSNPYGLSISDGFLFETNFGAGTLGRYDVNSGAGTNALITGFTNPYSVIAIPETSTAAVLAGLGALGAVGIRRRRTGR